MAAAVEHVVQGVVCIEICHFQQGWITGAEEAEFLLLLPIRRLEEVQERWPSVLPAEHDMDRIAAALVKHRGNSLDQGRGVLDHLSEGLLVHLRILHLRIGCLGNKEVNGMDWGVGRQGCWLLASKHLPVLLQSRIGINAGNNDGVGSLRCLGKTLKGVSPDGVQTGVRRSSEELEICHRITTVQAANEDLHRLHSDATVLITEHCCQPINAKGRGSECRSLLGSEGLD
mmetsp:Transcript_5065/g.11192  ORF Transcript_5065/g.11192 Transcript_5065/m.11192 type:complete len:229 (-) Transcript_5065:1826-2512(-)